MGKYPGATPYEQRYAVIMESGKVIKVTVYGENKNHGEGLAITEARRRCGNEQVWDIANMPVTTKGGTRNARNSIKR